MWGLVARREGAGGGGGFGGIAQERDKDRGVELG